MIGHTHLIFFRSISRSRAKKNQNKLTSGIIRTIHNKKLYEFIREFSKKNNEMHTLIARDFNLV